MLVVVGGPTGSAVAGEPGPGGLHLGRDLAGFGWGGGADQLGGEVAVEGPEHQGDVEGVAGPPGTAERGSGPGELVEVAAAAACGVRGGQLQAGHAEGPVGMGEDEQFLGTGVGVGGPHPRGGIGSGSG